MISNRNNFLTAYYSSSDLIQRQRSSIRRSQVLTIKSSNLEFNDSSTNNIHQQRIKRDLERQSPILIRRNRPTIENLSLHQQPTEIHDVYGNQLQLIPPPQSILRNKSPRASSSISKPIKYSKTIHENTSKHIAKSSHALPTPIWSPVLFEKEISPVRPFRSKSLFSKRTNTHNLSSNEKKSFTPDLFITPRMINIDDEIFKKVTVKDLVDEWEDPKSNVAVSSDEDDSSLITNCSNPVQNQFASSVFIPNQSSSRRPYNSYLPPVVENTTDEID